MNTAKNDIFIGLQPEYCYLDGEINLWWWQRIKIGWWWWWGVHWGAIPKILNGTIKSKFAIKIYVSNIVEHFLIVIFRHSIVT